MERDDPKRLPLGYQQRRRVSALDRQRSARKQLTDRARVLALGSGADSEGSGSEAEGRQSEAQVRETRRWGGGSRAVSPSGRPEPPPTTLLLLLLQPLAPPLAGCGD